MPEPRARQGDGAAVAVRIIAGKRERNIGEGSHHTALGDAIVTADGCELITRGVPVKADEIEALMRD